MKFEETKLPGAFVVDLQPAVDSRGFFSRAFCRDEFSQHGLNPIVAQCNLSFNRKAGTLRGMHYQIAPFRETKFVRCTSGSIFDVIIDLRPDSPMFRQWLGVLLSAENRCALYVPEGFAHGYLTLVDDSEILYMVSQPYSPGHERGIRWDDPSFGIEWPTEPSVISGKDANHPDFQ